MSKKTPKGLKELRSNKKKSPTDFNLSAHLLSGCYGFSQIRSQYGSWEEMEADVRYQFYDKAQSLCRSILENKIGYRHASDVLEDAPMHVFASLVPSVKDRTNSEDSDLSSNPEDFISYRHDYYEEVKESIKEKVVEALKEDSSMSDIPAFTELYDIAIKGGFIGSTQDFEKLLRTSNEFADFCKQYTTNYTG